MEPDTTKKEGRNDSTCEPSWLDGRAESWCERGPVVWVPPWLCCKLIVQGAMLTYTGGPYEDASAPPELKIVPDLAKSWEVLDGGKTYVFHLEEGVKFHDGTDFDAEVAKWNIDRILDPEV